MRRRGGGRGGEAKDKGERGGVAPLLKSRTLTWQLGRNKIIPARDPKQCG